MTVLIGDKEYPDIDAALAEAKVGDRIHILPWPPVDRREGKRRGESCRRKEPRTKGWYRWLVKNLREKMK